MSKNPSTIFCFGIPNLILLNLIKLNYFIRNSDLDFHPAAKKICINSDAKKSKSKKKKKKMKKKKNIENKDNSDNWTSCHLPNIINPEEKPLNELSNDLCRNLCEYNKDLMCKYL